MAKVKVHGNPMTPSTMRVLLCLHEKDIDYILVPVNLVLCEQKQPPFLSMNPFGKVPVVEVDNFTLFESRAITRYLIKERNSGTDLIGANNESAIVENWTEVEAKEFDPPIAAIYEEMYNPITAGKPSDEQVIRASLAKLGKVLDVYEERLSTNKYLAGSSYSMADMHHIPYLVYLMKSEHKYKINSRPHVKAWWREISNRPATLKVSSGCIQ